MNDTTNWEEELSKIGVWIEELSSNGDTLLIKVKDREEAFEYGIYDQKKLEALIPLLLSSQKQAIEKLIENKKKENPICACSDFECRGACGISHNAALIDILKALKEL